MLSFLQGPRGIAVLLVGIAVLLAIITGLNLRSIAGKTTAMDMQRLIKVSSKWHKPRPIFHSASPHLRRIYPVAFNNRSPTLTMSAWTY